MHIKYNHIQYDKDHLFDRDIKLKETYLSSDAYKYEQMKLSTENCHYGELCGYFRSWQEEALFCILFSALIRKNDLFDIH